MLRRDECGDTTNFLGAGEKVECTSDIDSLQDCAIGLKWVWRCHVKDYVRFDELEHRLDFFRGCDIGLMLFEARNLRLIKLEIEDMDVIRFYPSLNNVLSQVLTEKAVPAKDEIGARSYRC
jgi:hypothetical protein